MTDFRRQARVDEFVGQDRGHEDRIVDERRDRDVPEPGAIHLRVADAQGASIVPQRPHAQPDPQRNLEPMAGKPGPQQHGDMGQPLFPIERPRRRAERCWKSLRDHGIAAMRQLSSVVRPFGRQVWLKLP